MNQQIFYYLNNLAGKFSWFDNCVIFCAEYLPYVLAAVFFLILIFSQKDKIYKLKFLVFTGVSLFLARVVITELIRYFYPISRPFVNNDVTQLIFHETSASFPSGHAVFFFALAMAVYFFNQGLSLKFPKGQSFVAGIFFLGAILIGLARVIGGIHWPMDILAGAVAGVLSAYLVFKFAKNREIL